MILLWRHDDVIVIKKPKYQLKEYIWHFRYTLARLILNYRENQKET